MWKKTESFNSVTSGNRRQTYVHPKKGKIIIFVPNKNKDKYWRSGWTVREITKSDDWSDKEFKTKASAFMYVKKIKK